MATSRRSFIADPNAFDNADEYVRLYGRRAFDALCAIVRYRSNRQELASYIRSTLAPLYDFRKPIEKVRDRILDRLEFATAA
jgi:hypothetical protein